MFEAVITLCLAAADGPCRTHLLPGYEAETQAVCAAALAEDPPDLTVFVGLQPLGTAACQPIGETLDVTQVAPGIYVHMGDVAEPDKRNRGAVSNLGFVIGQSSVAVVDTGTARWMGEVLWRTIRTQTDRPVTHVIVTHMHPDHALGAAIFAEAGAKIVGHAGLARALADRQANYLTSLTALIGADALLGTRVAPVDIAVDQQSQIDLGDRVLHLHAWPNAHTGTDVTVLDVQTQTLFAGDLIFDRHLPALDGHLTGWRKVIETLADTELARVVPGHGGPVLEWPAGSAPMARYLSVLEADTRAAIKAGARLGDAVETVAQSERNLWELFDAYNPRNATVAFTELEWE